VHDVVPVIAPAWPRRSPYTGFRLIQSRQPAGRCGDPGRAAMGKAPPRAGQSGVWAGARLPSRRGRTAGVLGPGGGRAPQARRDQPGQGGHIEPDRQGCSQRPRSWPLSHRLDQGSHDAPVPIIAQTAPGRGLGARCRAAAAATTAATGIGHGAATPAPAGH